jgi:hypothetical protein
LIRISLFQAFTSSIGKETIQFSQMIGMFSFLWKLVSNCLHFGTNSYSKRNGAIAGAIAGLALLIETPENRVTIAQQFFMRSMQAGKNALKQRRLFSFTHGDTLLFSVAVASIMYAYTMHPSTIPREYYSWIVQHGRVPKVMLELNRSNTVAVNRGIQKVDVNQVTHALKTIKATPENVQKTFDYIKKYGYMPHVPCSCVHGRETSCTIYCVSVWYRTFIDMVPVYLSLNAVPTLVFKLKSVLQK